MPRRKPPSDEPLLFDPPLHPQKAERDLELRPRAKEAEQEQKREEPRAAGSLPLFPELESGSAAGGAPPADPAEPRPTPRSETDSLLRRPAPVVQRLLAGLADLSILGAVLVLLMVGQRWLEIPLTWEQWPAFLLFLLVFSFLYVIVPLAFWGQTPGMACFGLVSLSDDGENLTFPQTTVRWLGCWLTCLLLGLPTLLALGGRSLCDRISRSQTLIWEEAA